MCFPTNYLDKASKFAYAEDILPFQLKGYLVVYEACTVVSQLLNAYKTQREGNSQSLRSRHTRISDCQKETTSEQSLPVRKLIQTSFHFYFLHVKVAFTILLV